MKTGFTRRYYQKRGSWNSRNLCSVSFDTDSGREYEVKFYVNASHDMNADCDTDGNRGHEETDVECDDIKSLNAVVYKGAENSGRYVSIRKFNPDKLPSRLEEAMNKAIDKYIDDGEWMEDFAADEADAKERAYEMRHDL